MEKPLQDIGQVKSVSGEGEITFKGRGQAIRRGRRFVLRVCPECSQWNSRKAAEAGHCGWCAYVPSLSDAEPASRN